MIGDNFTQCFQTGGYNIILFAEQFFQKVGVSGTAVNRIKERNHDHSVPERIIVIIFGDGYRVVAWQIESAYGSERLHAVYRIFFLQCGIAAVNLLDNGYGSSVQLPIWQIHGKVQKFSLNVT